MAMICGYFDSTKYEMVGNFAKGDKALSSDALAKMLNTLVGNGVMPSPLTCFAVIAKTGMTVTLKSGFCMINGRFAYDDADADHMFDISTTRQTIWALMRLNLGTGDIMCRYESDVAGLPLRTATQHDIVLAKINIPPNATAITDSMITDCRYDGSLCGIMSGALGGGIDVTAIYNAINAISINVSEKFSATTNGNGKKYLSDDGSYKTPFPVKFVQEAVLLSSGTFSPKQHPSFNNLYKIVLIGGGGGGGGGAQNNYNSADGINFYIKGGGGGGAGGIYEIPIIEIIDSINFQIGNGGSGGESAFNRLNSSDTYGEIGVSGGNTTFSGYTAYGGGGGGKGFSLLSPSANEIIYGLGGVGGTGTMNGGNGANSTYKQVQTVSGNSGHSDGGLSGKNTLYNYGNGSNGANSFGYMGGGQQVKTALNGENGAIIVFVLKEQSQ